MTGVRVNHGTICNDSSGILICRLILYVVPSFHSYSICIEEFEGTAYLDISILHKINLYEAIKPTDLD